MIRGKLPKLKTFIQKKIKIFDNFFCFFYDFVFSFLVTYTTSVAQTSYCSMTVEYA